VGALFSLDLRTHFTDWECEVVVVVAGSVGYDLREVGGSVSRSYQTMFMKRSQAQYYYFRGRWYS